MKRGSNCFSYKTPGGSSRHLISAEEVTSAEIIMPTMSQVQICRRACGPPKKLFQYDVPAQIPPKKFMEKDSNFQAVYQIFVCDDGTDLAPLRFSSRNPSRRLGINDQCCLVLLSRI
jgi:hypothetical protein